MKRSIIILAVFISLGAGTYAQGFFNQNATQRKYMLEQIAALKVYGGLLRKGYNTVRDGTHLIGSIKNGEFNLHTAYFNSLVTVNPAIRDDSRIKAILKMESDMAGMRQKIMQAATDSNVFSGAELPNLKGVLDNLGKQSAEDLDELELVVSDDRLQMSDDERLRALAQLYSMTQGKYTYLKKLTRSVTTLVEARKQILKDAGLLKTLYGKTD